MSRFDLIFIVRDIRNEAKDKLIAEHVMGIHIHSENFNDNRINNLENELSLHTMKRFISYCRSRRAPSLSPAASKLLQNHYILIRDAHRRQNLGKCRGGTSVPITVRQLEAIIRISESLAKMSLSMYVDKRHVDEAIRLFKVSTGSASLGGENHFESKHPKMLHNMQITEDFILRRVAIGTDIVTSKLLTELHDKGFKKNVVVTAVQVLKVRGILKEFRMGKVLRRVR